MSTPGCTHASLRNRGMLQWSQSHLHEQRACATRMVRSIVRSYQLYECFCAMCNPPENKPVQSHEGEQSLSRNAVALGNVHLWHTNMHATQRCPHPCCFVIGNEQKASPRTVCAASSSQKAKTTRGEKTSICLKNSTCQ